MGNKEGEPKRGHPVRNLALITFLLMSGFTLGRICERAIIDGTNEPPPQLPPGNPTQLKPSELVLSSPETHELQLKLLRDYLSIKRRYETLMREPLTIDETRLGDTPAASQISQLARQHLLDGIYLVRITLPVEKSILPPTDPDHPQAIFYDRTFDLNNPLHFHILGGIVELELENHLFDWEKRVAKTKEEDYRLQQEKNRATIQDLLWLFDKNPAMTIDPDAFAFLPVTYLQNHAKTLQVLEKAGLPFPRKVSYIRHQKGMGGAGYHNHNNPEPLRFTIGITNNSGDKSIFHEVGHFISDATYLDPKNPRLKQASQAEYERSIKASLEKHGQNIKTLNNSFIVDPPPPNLIEDYAATFEEYFWRGREFREKLRDVEESDPAAYQVLITKYQFMKALFNGLAFTQQGEVWVRKYDIGSNVLIWEEDKDKPGIFLRKNLSDDLDPFLPAVFGGDSVKILEGPMVIGKRTFWKVKINWQTSRSSRLLGYLGNAEGWIPEDYLGEIKR